MARSRYYNPSSEEDFMDAKIIGGSPSGILNFSRTPHAWAYNIYRLMESNSWFPEECGLERDIEVYKAFSPASRKAYDLTLAQLIQNDSVQACQLVDNIGLHITSPVVKAALTLQAAQENLHARSYSVVADTVCNDPDAIYNLHKSEPMLLAKNNAVASMYDNVTKSSTPTEQELIVACAANQILEELVFPCGFIVLWYLRCKGTNKMISFIQRDEAGTHVPLFKNIYRAMVRQCGIQPETKNIINKMVSDMVKAEKTWVYYLTKDLLGFTHPIIDEFIEYQANSVMKNLSLPLLYKDGNGGELNAIVRENTMIGANGTKTNLFETPSADYDKSSMDDDY